LSFHRVKLHLIGKSTFTRQDVFSLMIGFYHADNRFIIGHFSHNGGNGCFTDCHTSDFAPVSRQHLIPTVRHRTHDCRLMDAVFTDTLRHIQHGFVLPDLKGVVGEVAYL